MDKILIGAIVVFVVVLVGGFLFVVNVDFGGIDEDDILPEDPSGLSSGPSGVGLDDGGGDVPVPVKRFVVTGENYKFFVDGVENGDVVVNQGDRVVIEFSSTAGFHDFVLEGLDVGTDRVNAGESSSVEFVADSVGSFKYYCSVGQHRLLGMEGNFIVE